MAMDSMSIRVNWSSPAQPNGVITQYRLQVLAEDSLLRDIVFSREPNENDTAPYEFTTSPPDPHGNGARRRRSVDLAVTSSPPAFTPTMSDRPPLSGWTTSGLSSGPDDDSDTPDPLTTPPMATEPPPASASSLDWLAYTSASEPTAGGAASADDVITEAPSAATPPPWLTQQWEPTADTTSDSSPMTPVVTPDRPRPSTRGAGQTSAGVSTSPAGVQNFEMSLPDLSTEVSYVVSDLRPFTVYAFRVTASTPVGEGPATQVEEKTSEQVPSAVLDVSYRNVTSTSVLVSWSPPMNPNGLITGYTVYALNLDTNQPLQRLTNGTTVLLTDLGKFTRYKVRIAAATLVGESSLSEEDDVFIVTEEDEPDSPPVDVAAAETTPTTVTLTWSPPEKANGVIRRYEVLYENETFSGVVNASRPGATLTHLKPFSRYNVSVRAYTRLGHGNHTSDTVRLLAAYNLSYEAVSPSEVNVTWQPPLVPNGVILHYSLPLWNSTHSLVLISNTSSLHIGHLRKYASYRLAVQAHTLAGPGNHTSEPLNITTLEDGTPPQFLRAKKVSDYQVELSWEPPLEANSDIIYYILRVWNETSETWQNVTGTSVVITVDSESNYNASVSSWTRLGDGGVIISISFTTLDAEPFDPPQNVTVSHESASSVTLSWSPPTEPNGIIVRYTIHYSQNHTVVRQNIPVSTLHATGSPGSAYSYTLGGLVGGTNYTLWMTSSTWQGDGGVHSPPLSLVLPEDVPNDPVHNLTSHIYSSTSIIVSWDPPQEPNGRPHYLLTLQEAGSVGGGGGGAGGGGVPASGSPPLNKTIEVNTTDTGFMFTKLRKYFQYVFTVTPATGAGAAYNYTSTLHLRTDDDKQSVVLKHPLEPNGEITGYTVTLLGPGAAASSDTTHTPNTSLTLADLAPYTPYNLSISAWTSKGSGPALQLLLHTDEAAGKPPLEPNGNSSGAANSEHLSGFRPHGSYVISVFSYTRVGHGDQYSSPITFTTNESVSDPVGNLSCWGQSWDSIQLSWDQPANPNGQVLFYRILVDSVTATTAGPAAHQAFSASEYTVGGLEPDRLYTLSVSAVNSAGPGDQMNCTTDTLPESVPGPPGFLAVSLVTATSVTLNWAPPSSLPGMLKEYHITVQLLAPGCLEPQPSPPIASRPTIATSTTNTTTNTTTTTMAAATPPPPPPPPPAPPGELAAGCAVDSQTVVPVNGSESAGGNHSIHSLAKHRAYRFRVAALTNAGVGEQSAWVPAHTLAGMSDPVGNLSCWGQSWDSIQLSWDQPANPNGQVLFYRILVDSVTATTAGPAAHQAFSASEYTVGGLEPDRLYTLSVSAVNSAGPGDQINCTTNTLPESVPGAPGFLAVSLVTATSVTLNWAPPSSLPGMLKEYHITTPETVVPVNGSESAGGNHSIHSLAKHRAYRFRVAALTNAGVGEQSAWVPAHTLAGNPDAPPRSVAVNSTSHSLQVEVAAANVSVVRVPGELRRVLFTNLTAFTLYSVTVTAFTGLLEGAARDGKASPPVVIRTQEEEPKDAPKNVTLAQSVTRVNVTFTPPRQPNGNISSYQVEVEVAGRGQGQQRPLVMNISGLNVIRHADSSVTVIIDGLKGGHNYSIRIAAVNGAGKSPFSPEVQITTGMTAPAKPTRRPQAVIGRGEVAVVTHRSITIHKPACFYSDDNGPIRHIQVIVAESAVKDGALPLTNWKNAFLYQPAPYLTDGGFANPPCAHERGTQRATWHDDGGNHGDHADRAEGIYVIGEDDGCGEEEDALCNGRLKPNTVYVFKFRATNIQGQYTDSEYSEDVKTTVDGVLTRDEQIILGVLLPFFLVVLLIIIIFASVRIHQCKNEGATYSPREAEIIETKLKLDQLIAVADMELKEDKMKRLLLILISIRPVNKKSFLQHVADLCANENTKFQEEFAELPKLLQDLATSDADLPWNRSKNRFTNIKPYNNNRVKLLSEPGMPGSDYINASFISGPLPGTVADFWRMVWETGTRTIAMLTQCYEKGRIRCHQYWPEDNKPLTVFGDIIITKLAENVFPDWTHGVPESSGTLIQFVKAVRANRHENTTIVVHC
ncbi:hypothetical protein CRUP_037953, partial [Coryphaenoides rupestris]